MFDVISTAKNTQWSSFPTLCSKYTHSHVANETVDFQVIPGKNCFVEFNKKFGFELMRTINKDNKEVIQRIKKRQVDDISCGSISKTSGSEIAIGMTTGFIRLYNVQNGEYIPFKFKPDRIGNSVVGMDYSNTDEYLAAVYDSADINLYGLKTGIKTDTFRFDGLSTLVRFHPARKFALAIGSYEGAITMLDIQTKKKLFFDKTAHDAPIRDISMFESSQDLFISCGYDCNINVFDLRKRTVVQQHKQPHPMSTVCVSSCGTFCVAGNLKGDVISYDFRSMKEPLDTKRLHDSAVVRVAFVPSITSTSNITLDQTVNSTQLESTGSMAFSTPQASGGESFAKFVDLCHYNNLAVIDANTPKRHESWSDLMPGRKPHDFSMDSVAETPMGRSELRLKRLSRASLDQSIQSNVTSADQNEINFEIKVTDFDEQRDLKAQHDKRAHLGERDKFGDLQNIQEESTEASHLEVKRPLDEHDSNMNKGRKRRSTFFDMFSKDLRTTNMSSPPAFTRTETAAAMEHGTSIAATIASTSQLQGMLSNIVDQEINSTRTRMTARMEVATNTMKARINQYFNQTYNNINKVLEEFYLMGLQDGDDLFSRLTEPFSDLENSLCSLLKQDPNALESFRMKYEIIELKKKLGICEPKKIAFEEENTCKTDGQNGSTKKKWLHTVNHKEFSDAFAAFVQKAYAEFDGDETKVDSKLGQQTVNEEDKENCQNNQQNRKSTISLAESITNTPNRRANKTQVKNGEMIMVNANELNEMLNGMHRKKLSALEMEFDGHMRKWQNNVTSYIDVKLQKLTSEVRYMQGRYFHNDFNHRYVSHMELEAELDLFDEGLTSLLHLNTIQSQYPNYASELEDLRYRFHEQQRLHRQ